MLLKTGDVSKYVQQSIRAGTDEWEQLVCSLLIEEDLHPALCSSSKFPSLAVSIIGILFILSSRSELAAKFMLSHA